MSEGSTPDGAPVGSIVSSLEELSGLYRSPIPLVASKKAERLDAASRGIVARSPFALIGTDGADGGLDILASQGLVPTNDAGTREFLEPSYLDDLARNAADAAD